MRAFLLLLALSSLTPAIEAAAVRISVQPVDLPPQSEPVPVGLRFVPHAGEPASRIRETKELSLKAPGEILVDLAPGRVWRLEVQAEGYWAPEQLVVPAGKGEDEVVFRLLPAGTLKAKIEPPRGGEAPSELSVRFRPAPGSGKRSDLPEEAMLACPVKEGTWTCVVPAGRLDLRIKGGGMTPLHFWGTEIQAARVKDLGVLALRQSASVAGWIEREDGGGPLQAVRVELAPQGMGLPDSPEDSKRMRSLAQETRSNERGFFQFEGVPPGSYVVKVSADGFAPARVAPVAVREGLHTEILEPIILGRPVSLEVILEPPVNPYGQPWRLRLSEDRAPDEPGSGRWEKPASREGRWSQSGLAPGRYRLHVLGDLGSRVTEEELRLERGQPPLRIEIPVVEVHGRVTLGDDPLAATLWFGGRSGARRIRFDADEKGRFEGWLPEEGTWPVDLVSGEGGLRLTLDPVEVDRLPGKRAAEVAIEVPDTLLHGEVVDEAGRSVPGALVSFLNSRGGHRMTDEKGRFELRGLRPGLVGVEAEEGNRSSGVVEVTVEEDRETAPLKLVVRENTEVKGLVVSSLGPVPGAELVALPAVDQVAFASGVTAITGVDGGFTLRFPSAVRSFQLFVFAPGHAFHMRTAVVERDRPLEVVIEAAGGTLAIELPAEVKPETPLPLLVHNGTFTGLPILNRWLRLQGARPQRSGRIEIPNMEAGAYSLCVGASAELRQGKEPEAGRCEGGFLSPQGELTLRIPSPGR
jgi:Carboxypeptidase regulatory-like domain